VAFFGSAVSAARIDAFLGVMIVTVSFVYKFRQEEALLTGEFGEEYANFIRCVPALIPLWWTRHQANQSIQSEADQRAALRNDM
jgi:protein-S-isoprenylcysteine O-methyltransferase Ste14